MAEKRNMRLSFSSMLITNERELHVKFCKETDSKRAYILGTNNLLIYWKNYKHGDDAESWSYIAKSEAVPREIVHINESLNSTNINL
jgi:hypothetical protein